MLFGRQKRRQPYRPTSGAAEGPADCIILSHDYGALLPECLDSILNQTLPFGRVLVVDDASQDDTAAVVTRYGPRVEYLRVDYRDQNKARNAGVQHLGEQRFLLFMDADNRLEPNWHERVRSAFSDPACAVAYTAMHLFDGSGWLGYSKAIIPYSYHALRRQNLADSASLIRREAFDQVGGYPDTGHLSFADWALWLRITAAGWTMKLVDGTALEYRVHAGQVSQSRGIREELDTLRQVFNVCIVTPFCGRGWALERYFGWLQEQGWPPDSLHLVGIDNSGDQYFGPALARYLADAPCDTTYVPASFQAMQDRAGIDFGDDLKLRQQNTYTVNRHMARLYSTARRYIPTGADLVLTLEDDIVPPANAIEGLLLGLLIDRGADVCAGQVIDRFTGHLIGSADPQQGYTKDIAGLFGGRDFVPMASTGFGCTLFRREAWDRIAFRPSLTWGEQYPYYDWAAADQVRSTGARWLLAREVVCRHYRENGRWV
jgi:glycosyltransferase involved in cell wall biosynthesis